MSKFASSTSMGGGGMSFGSFGGAFKKKKQSLGPGSGSNKNSTLSKMTTKRLSKISQRVSTSTKNEENEEESGAENDSFSEDSPKEPGTDLNKE